MAGARSVAAPQAVPPDGAWLGLPAPVRDLVTFLALAFFPVVPLGIVSGAAVWTVALLVVQAAAVVVIRRRAPLVALAVAAAFFVVAFALGVVNPIPALPVAAAAYAVALLEGRRAAVLAVAAAAGFVAVSSLLLVPGELFDPRAISMIAVVAAAGALGDAARSRRAYIVAITERAIRAEETRETEAQRRVAEDRLRIARDLHDVVAHQIAVINLHAGVASAALTTDPPAADESLRTIRGAARAVLTEIGDLLAMLRTSAAPEATELAPVTGLDGLADLVEGFSDVGLRVSTEVEGSLSDLDPAVDVVAYRVVQEGLTNAHKHGTGGTARLTVHRTDRTLCVRVSNPRAPGDRLVDAESGYGLQGVRERVESVRGTMQVERSDPRRFVLEVGLPLQPQPSLSGLSSR